MIYSNKWEARDFVRTSRSFEPGRTPGPARTFESTRTRRDSAPFSSASIIIVTPARIEWGVLLGGRLAVPTSSTSRPLSITAAGLYMLFGACLMPVNIWRHAPAFLLGADFRDWPAVLFFLAIGTLDAGIGIGLLRFAPWSRMAGIYFFLFRILNTAITFLLPGSRARFEAGVAAVEASLGRAGAPHAPLWFGAVLELGVMGLV